MGEEHQNFPRVGMRKCAIWTFSTKAKFLRNKKTIEGDIIELWRIYRGESFIGGFYYYILVENDKITYVSEREPEWE